MVAYDTDGEYKSGEFDRRCSVDDFSKYFAVGTGSKSTIGLLDDTFELPIPKSYFLKGRGVVARPGANR